MLPPNGQWGELITAFVGIKLVCGDCYDQARSRNWSSVDTDAFERLLCDATPYLECVQTRTMKEFCISKYERYDWDQETAKLIFSHEGQQRVVADITFVGSVSTVSNTWLWSWANTSLSESIQGNIRQVRLHGEDNHLLKLASARWGANQEDGWEMTAIAAFLLGAVGAYRTPGEYGFTFMIMNRVAWAI